MSQTTTPKPHRRRAPLAEEALKRAAEAVVTRDFTDARVQECFPTYKGDPAILTQLGTLVRERFTYGLPLAWQAADEDHDFIKGANALDDLLDDAKKRKEAGRPPREMYKKASDAELTISSATVPRLRAATADIRARRLALEAKNAATFAQITKDSAAAARTEAQIGEMLADFDKSMEILGKVDIAQLEGLQAKLIEVVPQ